MDYELLEDEIKDQLDVATYYNKYIDKSIFLLKEGTRCPFHRDSGENKLTLNRKTGKFRCWVCGAAGDVIDLHGFVMNRQQGHWMPESNTVSRKKSIENLAKMLNLDVHKVSFAKRPVLVDKQQVAYTCLLHQANALARTVSDWLKLDYIMSIYISDNTTLGFLIDYIEEHGGKVSPEFDKYRLTDATPSYQG